MQLIGALTVIIVVAVSASLAAGIVVVILGIRHEERAQTMMRRLAPGMAARLARLVVGLYVRKTEPEPEPAPPDDRIEPPCPVSTR